MSKPTITEFLEARIAEDEDDALPDAGWAGYQGYCDAAGVHHSPERALAECAAKRAVLDLHDGFSNDPSKDSVLPWATLNLIIEALTAIYKDHPDYQQEWAL